MLLHKFQRPELLVHDEYDDLLHTDKDITPLAIPFFYKRKKRDVHGFAIPCHACNKELSGNIEGSFDCPYCEGFGYEFEEGIEEGWFYSENQNVSNMLANSVPKQAAMTYQYTMNLTTSSNVLFQEGDVILRPELMTEGEMKIPIVVDGMYRIHSRVLYASNQSNSEFNVYGLTTIQRKYFRKIINYEPHTYYYRT